MLLVLDGVEHLGSGLAVVVDTLPVAPGGVWLLVTSRRSFGPSMYPLVRLGPLPTAGADSPAGQLLVAELSARGADVASSMANANRWRCVLSATGGLPAAVVLSADYVARFGIGLEDLPAVPTDAIIERCIVRTLTLMTEAERLAFLRLGLTAGPFTLDVVAALTEEATPTARIILGALVENGLVFVRDDRFDLLPPVRDWCSSSRPSTGPLTRPEPPHPK